MAVIVDVNVKRFRIKKMLLGLGMEGEIFARECIKAKRISGRIFSRLHLNFPQLRGCHKLEIRNWILWRNSARHLVLGGFEYNLKVGLERGGVLDTLGFDLELLAAFSGKSDCLLTFQTNRVVTLAQNNLFDRVSAFVGQNENWRANRLDLETKAEVF